MGYCALAQSDDDEPFFSKMGHQNCLTCYFGDREELEAGEREIIKQLGYKFRGHNNWIYFRSMKTGYFPWSLGAEQVVFLTEALSQFLAAYDDFSSGRVKVDFTKEETVLRKFDAEKDEWHSSADRLPPFRINLPRYTIDNDILIHSIKKKAVGNKSIEFDMVFLPFPVQEKKDEVPYMPCMLMLADRDNGLILDQHIVSDTEKEEDAAIDMLEKYVKKHGRPSALYVRDFRFQRYVSDLCDKTDIKLIVGEAMYNIDEAVGQLIEHMGGR